LDLADVERRLVGHDCNVAATAKTLGVPTRDLSVLTRAHPALMAVAFEAVEQGLDSAAQVVWDGLRSEGIRPRLEAASFLLRHAEAGWRRGFSWRRGGASG
jgi:hypothetical protein